jgi:hypothetical protein
MNMSAASLTPRVRILVVCDEVTASEIEAGVFNLEGVRQYIRAESFSCLFRPSLFLLLSCPRKGTYPGKVLVINEQTDQSIRYVKFQATFEKDNELLPLYFDLGDCEFPTPGLYTFQVWFTAPHGEEALKAEHPFYLLTNEE